MVFVDVYRAVRMAAARVRHEADAEHTALFFERVMALVLAVWGWQLISPLSVFSSPAYAAFFLFRLTETHWGILFFGVALALTAGQAFKRPRLRILGLIGATGVFAFVGVMLAIGNAAGFGWAGQFGYAAACLHLLRRLQW